METTINQSAVEKALSHPISEERKALLLTAAEAIYNHYKEKGILQMVFVCTHNSRRSQLSEVLALLAAQQYNLSVSTFSAGTEATAVHENTMLALKEVGVSYSTIQQENQVAYSLTGKEMAEKTLFSKTLTHESLPTSDFFAFMTCDQAAENCPFVPGAVKRIPLTYKDPKVSDNTPEALATYGKTATQILSEMMFIFAQIHAYEPAEA